MFAIVNISVALATVVIPFPCANVAVLLFEIVCGVPLDPAADFLVGVDGSANEKIL